MQGSHVRYTAEFRTDAVALVRSSGRSILSIAHDLGVNTQSLRNWLHRAAIDAWNGRTGELTTAEREELRRLRREVHILQQERDILKKATAFFAKETR